MTAISKNMYNDKLDDTFNKYSNKYHRTIKMKVIDAKSNTHTDFEVENNVKDPKFKVDDHIST